MAATAAARCSGVTCTRKAQWKGILQRDIASKALSKQQDNLDEKQQRHYEKLNEKLDRTLRAALRSTPSWVRYGFLAAAGLIGWLAAKVPW